jgi:hypothetical protein
MLNDPYSWSDHLKRSVLYVNVSTRESILLQRRCRSTASSILTTIYGMDPIQSKDDPMVVRINVSFILLYGNLF